MVHFKRYITYIRRLREEEQTIADFFASGLLQQKNKLGSIVWQFPPTFKFDKAQFEHFLGLLPKDTHATATYAENCGAAFKRTDIETPRKRLLRHCVEIRNKSFRSEEFVALLRQYNVGLAVADTAGRWPQQNPKNYFVRKRKTAFLFKHCDCHIRYNRLTDTAL